MFETCFERMFDEMSVELFIKEYPKYRGLADTWKKAPTPSEEAHTFHQIQTAMRYESWRPPTLGSMAD